MAPGFGENDRDDSWDIDRVLAGLDSIMASGGQGGALSPVRMVFRLRGEPDPAADFRETFLWVPVQGDFGMKDARFPGHHSLHTTIEELARLNGAGRRGPRITAALLSRAIDSNIPASVALAAAMMFDRDHRRSKDSLEARLARAALARLGFTGPFEVWHPTSKTVLPAETTNAVETVFSSHDHGKLLVETVAGAEPRSDARARALILLGMRLGSVATAMLERCRPALVRIVRVQKFAFAPLTIDAYDKCMGKDVVGFVIANGSAAWRDLSPDDLARLVWEMPKTAVARQFGISDRAVAKRCMKLGIETPPLGYWKSTDSEVAPVVEANDRSWLEEGGCRAAGA